MPITATVLTGVEPEHAGGASGMLQTTQQLGSAVGVAVIVSVYAAGAVPGEFLPGARAAFLTSALFSAVAASIAATVWLRGGARSPYPSPTPSRRSPWPTPPDRSSAPAAVGGIRRIPSVEHRAGSCASSPRARRAASARCRARR